MSWKVERGGSVVDSGVIADQHPPFQHALEKLKIKGCKKLKQSTLTI